MQAPQIILAALLGGSVFYTIFGYRSRYGALSGRSRLFRTFGLLLMDLLLALALMWFFIDFGRDTLGLARQGFYLASCVVLVLALLCIALLDVLETIVAARREERDFVRKILKEEIDQAKLREGAAGQPSQRTDASPGA
ncbi:MAG: hypothetical protein V4671_22485 [Armatimonadota bacterium]